MIREPPTCTMPTLRPERRGHECTRVELLATIAVGVYLRVAVGIILTRGEMYAGR